METDKENRTGKAAGENNGIDPNVDGFDTDKRNAQSSDLNAQSKSQAESFDANPPSADGLMGSGALKAHTSQESALQEEGETSPAISEKAAANHRVWKQIAPSVKTLILAFFLEEVFSLFSISALAFRDNMMWLSIILYILFLGITGAALFVVAKNTSYRDNNVIRLNEIKRKRGEELPKYGFLAEYRSYKGYIMGLALSLPLILFVLLSFAFTGGAFNNFAAAVRFIFCIFFVPVSYVNAAAPLAWMILVGVTFNVLIFGISYQLMGRKMQRQQERIRETMREIHGHFDRDGSDQIDV